MSENTKRNIEEEVYEDFDIMTITTEEGEEIDCAIIETFEVKGKDYIAIIAVRDIEDENSNVLLYQLETEADGQPKLNIIDDKVFPKVVEKFERIMEEMDTEVE